MKKIEKELEELKRRIESLESSKQHPVIIYNPPMQIQPLSPVNPNYPWNNPNITWC